MKAYADEESFGTFLKEQRTRKEASLEQLAEGLCSVSGLARIEKGERAAGKAVRDRLLYRLGISPDIYEQFLFAEEYINWKKRQQLLYVVSREDTANAWRLLGEYREKYVAGREKEAERRLEQQFCLALEAQILQKEAAGKHKEVQEKLGNLYREALELTVTLPGPGSVGGKAYSVQELNLMLETVYYGRLPDWERRYREILWVAEKSGFDRVSQAKIYPKAVYYLCREGLACGKWGLEEKAEAMERCTEAVECLRKAGRLYYLWELLQLLEELLTAAAAGLKGAGAVHKAEELEARNSEYREWKASLEAVYAEFGVPRETRDFCWLYVEKEVYCINEVIRIRREMLGITRKQLCGRIVCSEKTLGRLESGGKTIQKGIVRDLMKQLNLSAEYCRTELITDDPEAVKIMSELRDRLRNRETEQADRLLEQLKGRVSMEIPSNRQVWLRSHAFNEAYKEAITEKQCVEKIREALECTLPYDIAIKPGEKYLTNEEINCMQNMVSMNKGVDEEKARQIDMLEKQYEAIEKDGLIFCFINMYEIIMDCVASEWGNMGDYERSDEISRKIIMESLYQRRSFGIHRGIYNMLWNYEQQQRKGYIFQNQRNMQEDLVHCIVFSKLSMEKYNENFYWRKLSSWKGN